MRSAETAALDALTRERQDSGLFRRLATRVLALNPAERCCMFSLIAAAIAGWSFHWTHRFATEPYIASYLNVSVWRSYWYLQVAGLVSFGLIGVVAGSLRRSQPNPRWIIFLFVQAYFVFFAISVCSYGVFTSDLFGAIGITGAAIGTVFFERRAILFGLASFTAIVVVWTGAQMANVLPYAPLFTGGPIYDGVLSRVWVASIGLPVLIIGLVGLATTFLVISAWRDQARQNARLQAEIAEARETRLAWLENLAGFLRHELKNQLVGIGSSLRMLGSMPDADAPRYLARAGTSIDVMRRLITAATEATDLEGALRVESLEPVDLSDLVRNRVDGFCDEHRDRRVEASIEPGLRVRGSEARLVQLLDKLLSNAVEHSAEDGAIHVSLRSERRSAELAVANAGDPLPADTRKLFEPFVSVGKGPTSESLGLGLYVVRVVSEHLGGRVRATPLDEGTGARFAVVLPLLGAPE